MPLEVEVLMRRSCKDVSHRDRPGVESRTYQMLLASREGDLQVLTLGAGGVHVCSIQQDVITSWTWVLHLELLSSDSVDLISSLVDLDRGRSCLKKDH
jgi:hypothetical protein